MNYKKHLLLTHWTLLWFSSNQAPTIIHFTFSPINTLTYSCVSVVCPFSTYILNVAKNKNMPTKHTQEMLCGHWPLLPTLELSCWVGHNSISQSRSCKVCLMLEDVWGDVCALTSAHLRLNKWHPRDLNWTSDLQHWWCWRPPSIGHLLEVSVFCG